MNDKVEQNANEVFQLIQATRDFLNPDEWQHFLEDIKRHVDWQLSRISDEADDGEGIIEP